MEGNYKIQGFYENNAFCWGFLIYQERFNTSDFRGIAIDVTCLDSYFAQSHTQKMHLQSLGWNLIFLVMLLFNSL